MQNFLYFIKKYYKDMTICFLLLCSISLSLFTLFYQGKNKLDINSEVAIKEKETNFIEDVSSESQTIHIDVKGAVKKPGVYEIKKDAIIQDAITLAGGFKTNAYINGINLSKKVVDEMVLYIYTTNEVKPMTNKTETVIKNEPSTCNVPTYNITECVEDKESMIVPGDSTISNSASGNANSNTNNSTVSVININTASLKDLTSLTGIGDAKAKLIINYREVNGKFKAIDDIKNVKGIGDAIFEKIKNYITV